MQGRVYPTYKVVALDEELSGLGVESELLLRDTDIDASSMHSAA